MDLFAISLIKHLQHFCSIYWHDIRRLSFIICTELDFHIVGLNTCAFKDIKIHFLYIMNLSPFVISILIILKLHYLRTGSLTFLLVYPIIYQFCAEMLFWWDLYKKEKHISKWQTVIFNVYDILSTVCKLSLVLGFFLVFVCLAFILVGVFYHCGR